jgi:hypothetical protein
MIAFLPHAARLSGRQRSGETFRQAEKGVKALSKTLETDESAITSRG